MNFLKQLIVTITCTILISSCALHNGLTTNSNVHNSDVQLSKKNFIVVKKVEGSSEATYILGIGGMIRKALISEARHKMLENANLIGSSRAVINETIEVKRSLFPFVRKITVNASAYIIEFLE